MGIIKYILEGLGLAEKLIRDRPQVDEETQDRLDDAKADTKEAKSELKVWKIRRRLKRKQDRQERKAQKHKNKQD